MEQIDAGFGDDDTYDAVNTRLQRAHDELTVADLRSAIDLGIHDALEPPAPPGPSQRPQSTRRAEAPIMTRQSSRPFIAVDPSDT